MSLNLQGEKFRDRCGLTPDAYLEVLTRHPIPPPLVLGLIATESSGNPDAMRFERNYPYPFQPKEHAQALGWTEDTERTLQSFSFGLMQIMLATARECGFNLHPRLLFTPKINLAWGSYHLHALYRRFGTWPDAVAAYNFGHPARTLISGKFKNQDYVDKVFNAAARFERVGS